ncbi:MAG: segregation/condensation protein A [Archangium sp.]
MKDVSPAQDEALTEVIAPRDAFRIALPNFEGPLDLLLHLIREHKLDILDIPIALITEKYLGHLELMKEINLDIAGEFLVMASTLLHLKSRMLLPREDLPAGQDTVGLAQDELDPRAELVRRLLQYQKYREAADTLARQPILDRDTFPRRVRAEEVPLDDDEVGLQEISIYKLITALDEVLKRLEPKKQHEVTREHLSLSVAMYRIADRIRAEGKGHAINFFDLFEGARVRSDVVITFLALLEMCKLKLLRVFQEQGSEDIFISEKGDALAQFGTDGVSSAEDLDSEYE